MPGARFRASPHWTAVTVGLSGLMVAFLLLPVLALGVQTTLSDVLEGLRNPVVPEALKLSLFTTLTSVLLVIVFGTPLAWSLARTDARWARVLEALIQIPVVIPPAVAGLCLLFAFGRRGLLGALLGGLHVDLAFTTAAVVCAETFVCAPFFIQSALSSFRALDDELLIVAQSLGAGPSRTFFQVVLPITRRGWVGGAALAWARALGEFGATLMFAGNLAGKTQTLPLAVYTVMESDVRAAQAISVVLLVVAFLLLGLLRLRLPWPPPRGVGE